MLTGAEVVRIVYTPIITSLYTLIETLQDEVAPEDDAIVIAVVACLCNAGHIKFLNVSEDRELACTR
jgi:hypothetical protein